MTTRTKDDRIKSLKLDMTILTLQKRNKELVLENKLLMVETLKKELAIYKKKDSHAVEQMDENDDDHKYISYLEDQQRDLLKIVEGFIDDFEPLY